jgi:hypothetical protein
VELSVLAGWTRVPTPVAPIAQAAWAHLLTVRAQSVLGVRMAVVLGLEELGLLVPCVAPGDWRPALEAHSREPQATWLEAVGAQTFPWGFPLVPQELTRSAHGRSEGGKSVRQRPSAKALRSSTAKQKTTSLQSVAHPCAWEHLSPPGSWKAHPDRASLRMGAPPAQKVGNGIRPTVSICMCS